jgi:hypothetical protein
VRRTRRRDQVAELEAELEDVRPFLALAREIHDSTSVVVADVDASAESLVDAIAATPLRERLALVRATFDRLAPEEQWSIVERVFGDEEIRAALDAARRERLALARRATAHAGLISRARVEQRIDMGEIGEAVVTLGLFREGDVRAAIGRGPRSTTCARRLVLRTGGTAGTFHVVEDVFNPTGGFFVTGAYDRDTWWADRLPAHASVRVGSITSAGGDRSFEPVVHLAGRVDVERDGDLAEGRLHLGYLLVDDMDVFSGHEPS